MARHRAEACVLQGFLLSGNCARLSPEAVARLDECCLTSLQASARGCVPAAADREQVIATVEAVARGDVVAGPWIMALARHGMAGAGIDDPGPITPRELDVMVLVAKGLSNQEIADELGIQVQTAKNHLASLMAKMDVHSRLEVGLAATRYHVVLKEDEGTS
jgi:DNA-binding NarL/FixJ family response regulator